MTAKILSDKVFDRLKTFDYREVLTKLHKANDGAIEDYLNVNGCYNYQFTVCLVDVIRPKQVVELGGAMGVGTICLAYYLPKDSNLYSITLEEGGLEFSYIDPVPKNVHLIVGDDLDPKNWKDIDLSKTEIWYFDTGIAEKHSGEHLQKELEFFKPYFKKGTILMFDDIHLNKSMEKVWEDIRKERYGAMDCIDLTDPNHYSGWGLCIYEKDD